MVASGVIDEEPMPSSLAGGAIAVAVVHAGLGGHSFSCAESASTTIWQKILEGGSLAVRACQNRWDSNSGQGNGNGGTRSGRCFAMASTRRSGRQAMQSLEAARTAAAVKKGTATRTRRAKIPCHAKIPCQALYEDIHAIY